MHARAHLSTIFLRQLSLPFCRVRVFMSPCRIGCCHLVDNPAETIREILSSSRGVDVQRNFEDENWRCSNPRRSCVIFRRAATANSVADGEFQSTMRFIFQPEMKIDASTNFSPRGISLKGQNSMRDERSYVRRNISTAVDRYFKSLKSLIKPSFLYY